VDRLGFTSPWQYEEDGTIHVVQVEREGCAVILADTWPKRTGKAVVFVSLNLEVDAMVSALDALRAELEAKGVRVKEGSWGYRLLVIEDPDGNRLLFNYPNDGSAGEGP